MDHYYTNNQDAKHDRKRFSFTLKGAAFTFISDAGVFSKNTVDFGSRLLVEKFRMERVAKRFLDVGCGYGPIGLAVARVYPDVQVDMVDVNLRAVELAKENAALNQIDNVEIFESSIYEKVDRVDYDAILSNPPIRAGKVVVHRILSEAHDHLAAQGELWIVIQKKQGGPSAAAKMEEVFGNVETVAKDKGYYIYRSIKE
ncbi:class I SAM-dependent methyltransferase [Listeria costaricensis]|uniref:class I SAM-dependent methyltransferase n=1 Tax=Listeria costaricensis TaxID=2026604 RepID=UPI000C07FB33|nr:class I SAM-dependent methyltransferase [Listeria costaricensis]